MFMKEAAEELVSWDEWENMHEQWTFERMCMQSEQESEWELESPSETAQNVWQT